MTDKKFSINPETDSISFVNHAFDCDLSVSIRRVDNSDQLFTIVDNSDQSELKALAADLLQMVEDLSMDVIRNQTDGSMNWPNVIDRHRIECEGVAHLINRAKDMLGGNNADR